MTKRARAVEVSVRSTTAVAERRRSVTRNLSKLLRPDGALFTAFVLLAVTCGWLFRDRIPLTPKYGLGYALGVSGAVTTLLLGLYSAAKRLRFLRKLRPLSIGSAST